MKKLLPFLLLLAACHKSGDNPTPVKTPTIDTIHHFIRNWQNIPIWDGYAGDTIKCYTLNDTSYIIYRGQKLFVWTLQKNDSAEVIYNSYITPQCFDTSVIYSRCQVSGSRYYDKSIGWQNEFQSIWLEDKSHFDTSGEGIYSNF